MSFINAGYGNIVNADKILAVVMPDSAPAKRLIQNARERDEVIDATQGRKTRGVIISDGGRIILSALQPDTIAARLKETLDDKE